MRTVFHSQMSLGEEDIAKIKLDPKSRDDIPQLLAGLQYIYTTPELRRTIFKILEEVVPCRAGSGKEGKASTDKGRPGMEQWRILVLGTLRLDLNADYDRIHELANQHKTVRQMLGHGFMDDEKQYNLQRIKNNLQLFTPDLLDRINKEVVQSGHSLVKKNDVSLSGRCDSFVVKTDVHFPTDINLLFDAIRKTIEECAQLCELHNCAGWRQSNYNIKTFKKQYRIIQKQKHSTSKDEAKRLAFEENIKQSHRCYIDQAEAFLQRARATRQQLIETSTELVVCLGDLDAYIAHAERQKQQINSRVLQGKAIPHEEKVFSIFQPHTEWISKGKAGVPVELGLRVCVLEDRTGFILHHRVMQNETDDKIAVVMVAEAKQRFPHLTLCSFDKGFHSPQNQIDLKAELSTVVLPKKGRLSVADKERESSPEFVEARQQHSNRRSTLLEFTVWIYAGITELTASNGMSPSPWLPATSSTWAQSSGVSLRISEVLIKSVSLTKWCRSNKNQQEKAQHREKCVQQLMVWSKFLIARSNSDNLLHYTNLFLIPSHKMGIKIPKFSLFLQGTN